MVNEDRHGKVFRWHGIPVASSGKGVRVALVASGGASVAGYFSMSESGTTYNANAWTIQNLNAALAITSFLGNSSGIRPPSTPSRSSCVTIVLTIFLSFA